MIPYREFLRNLPHRPTIVAHRGAWRHGPENSVPAVAAAADMGCEIAEIDVQVSADGQLFVLHDENLVRMTGHDAIAQNLPLAEIHGRPLRYGWGGKDEAVSTVGLPRFEEVLEAARGRIYLDVDVKHGRNLELASAAIAAAGMTGQAAVKVRVQDSKQAEHLRNLEDEYGLMVMPKTLFEEETADDLLALLTGIGTRVCEATFDNIETIEKRRDAFVRSGIALWVNTLNEVSFCGFADSVAETQPDAIWGRLMNAGVSIIQTDLPEVLSVWRSRRREAT